MQALRYAGPLLRARHRTAITPLGLTGVDADVTSCRHDGGSGICEYGPPLSSCAERSGVAGSIGSTNVDVATVCSLSYWVVGVKNFGGGLDISGFVSTLVGTVNHGVMPGRRCVDQGMACLSGGVMVKRRVWRCSGVVISSVCLMVLGVVVAPTAQAADAPFTLRYSTDSDGNGGALATIGNTLMTCQTSAPDCAAARAGNNSSTAIFNMVYVDADSDPTTFNSSMATWTTKTSLTGTDDLKVYWAGLYWGGDATGTKYTNKMDSMLLKVPGGGLPDDNC